MRLHSYIGEKMARETKQDRLVRSMSDQVMEQVHQLKSLASNPASKELDLERWCEAVFKTCLGFTAINGYSIRAQESRGKHRPDLIILKADKPVCVVEVKKLGFDLDKSDLRSGKLQLGEYLNSLGSVQWGILCNGYEFRLFDFSNQAAGGIEVLGIDIRNDAEELDFTKKGVEEICWELLDLHEQSLAGGAWLELAREATAFSPESLARAILSADVVRYVAKAIRGEHDYRANLEVLSDRLVHLLSNGLDDAVPGWNEVKQAELSKYLKSQKRAGRKRRTSAKKGLPLDIPLENTIVPSTDSEEPPTTAA